jgi:zona occludens toxin (predicted ATPase)
MNILVKSFAYIKKDCTFATSKKQSLIKDMKVYILVNLVVLHIINVVVVTYMV